MTSDQQMQQSLQTIELMLALFGAAAFFILSEHTSGLSKQVALITAFAGLAWLFLTVFKIYRNMEPAAVDEEEIING